MKHRKICPVPGLEEIRSVMDVRRITNARMAEMVNEKYGHLTGREVTKEDLDGLFARSNEPKILMVSILRWTLEINGIPAPEKWVSGKSED